MKIAVISISHCSNCPYCQEKCENDAYILTCGKTKKFRGPYDLEELGVLDIIPSFCPLSKKDDNEL